MPKAELPDLRGPAYRSVLRICRPGLLGPAICAIVTLAACSGNGKPRAQFLSIATGGTGGVYYPYGGGLAKVLNENLPNVRATAEVTSASVDNLKLIRDGKADIAFTTADALADAVEGRGTFEGRAVPVRTLAALYMNYAHLVTTERTGIQRLDQLKGRTVSVGSPGSGTEITADRLLRTAGLDPARDVVRHGLSVSESAGALKDGKIDAFFWNGGVPTPALQDLAHSQGLTMRLIPTGGAVEQLQREYAAVYHVGRVPSGVYRGVGADVAVLGMMNLLVVSATFDESLAYEITRVLFEKQSELAAIHPEARNLSLATAVKGSPAAFHPGALRFYKERGITQ